jgi:hypothetical protein
MLPDDVLLPDDAPPPGRWAALSRGTRLAVAALVLLALLLGAAMLLFATNACPVETAVQPCPGVGVNRLVVIGLAALTSGLLVVPFAFLAEFVFRRRIEYRGAWPRAARRGVLVGVVIAVLAGLRLGGALTVPAAMFVILLAGAGEWFAIRRLDMP